MDFKVGDKVRPLDEKQAAYLDVPADATGVITDVRGVGENTYVDVEWDHSNYRGAHGYLPRRFALVSAEPKPGDRVRISREGIVLETNANYIRVGGSWFARDTYSVEILPPVFNDGDIIATDRDAYIRQGGLWYMAGSERVRRDEDITNLDFEFVRRG